MKKKIRKELLPLPLYLFYIEHKYFFSQLFKFHAYKLRKLTSDIPKDNLEIKDMNLWIQKLCNICYAIPELGIELGRLFFKTKISIVKPIEISSDDILFVCIQKNDTIKMKSFLNHHRKIGAHKFIILDNNSTDGSKEWLLEQEDVFLLESKDPYTTLQREAWINRIYSYFGYNRWYVVLDSDELLIYDNCERKTINDLVSYFETHKVKRGLALMTDMYANSIYYKSGDSTKYLEDCCYFDSDSYEFVRNDYLHKISGGPRKRVFNIQKGIICKYPVLYLESEDLQYHAHRLFPFSKNWGLNCQLILQHYKFLRNDIEKYRQRAKEGNFGGNSIEYKKYMSVIDNEEELDFFYKGTTKYEDSSSFQTINIYKPIKW